MVLKHIPVEVLGIVFQNPPSVRLPCQLLILSLTWFNQFVGYSLLSSIRTPPFPPLHLEKKIETYGSQKPYFLFRNPSLGSVHFLRLMHRPGTRNARLVQQAPFAFGVDLEDLVLSHVHHVPGSLLHPGHERRSKMGAKHFGRAASKMSLPRPEYPWFFPALASLRFGCLKHPMKTQRLCRI